MSNGVVEENECHNSGSVIVCQHGFNPFSDIIDNHCDLLMATIRHRFTFHEANEPFIK